MFSRRRRIAAALSVIMLATVAASAAGEPGVKATAGAAPAVAAKPAAKAPPGPPDGTYVYAISRNGTDQGKTTVTVFRRDDASELETNESGYVGAASVDIVAAYRYGDLANDSYVATYRAPFLKSSAFGALFGTSRTFSAAGEPATVRYRIAGTHAEATIDGIPRSRIWDALVSASRPDVKTRWIFDAPFMTGVMLAPIYRHRSGDAELAPVSAAFDEGVDLARERIVSAAPHFSKTPKTDAALSIGGLGTIWFNRGNWIVDEAHFDGLDFDARLVSYARRAAPPAMAPLATVAARPHLVSRPLDFADADGSKIAGLLDLPASGKPRAPAIVFVPPSPDATINYPDDGPDPMYPNLATAFAERGYAIVRYPGPDAAGTTVRPATWEGAIEDLRAAIAAASDDDAIDPNRVYLLGYGVGADLALAVTGSPDSHVAGVVALGPTAIGYRDCATRTKTSQSGGFFRSAAAHDPALLAQRSRVPAFVLHSATPACDETRDETTAYDEKLRASNPRATIVVASDLTARFGGLYDADSALDTEEFFPYHFDPSTRDAIADWLDNPKVAATGSAVPASGGPRPPAPPPPPHVTDPEMNGEMPNPHVSPSPARSVDPGVVLPPGATPPAYEPEASPTPAPTSQPTPAPSAS